MSQSFIQEFKLEKNIESMFEALSNFEKLSAMIDKNPMNAHFIPFMNTVEDKLYFYTTVLGKRGVVSINRGDKNFNNAVHHNPSEIIQRILNRCFYKFLNNISNKKMVVYSINIKTGLVSNIIKLYKEDKTFCSIIH